MDESAPIRAIVIGVSVLLAIATISAVLMYYNTAKQMASNVGRGQDFAGNYEQSIQDILTKGSYNVAGKNYVTGADVKNLLNYFYGDESMWIVVNDIRVVNGCDDSYIPSLDKITNASDAAYKKENYNKVMKNILDNQRFELNVTQKSGNFGEGKRNGIAIDISSID